MDRATAEARFPTAFAGIEVCRRLVVDLPDQPLYVDDWDDGFYTPAYQPDRPYVRLSPNRSTVAVHPQPGKYGNTEWVEYPISATPEIIQSDGYYAELRAVVVAKLEEIR